MGSGVGLTPRTIWCRFMMKADPLREIYAASYRYEMHLPAPRAIGHGDHYVSTDHPYMRALVHHVGLVAPSCKGSRFTAVLACAALFIPPRLRMNVVEIEYDELDRAEPVVEGASVRGVFIAKMGGRKTKVITDPDDPRVEKLELQRTAAMVRGCVWWLRQGQEFHDLMTTTLALRGTTTSALSDVRELDTVIAEVRGGDHRAITELLDMHKGAEHAGDMGDPEVMRAWLREVGIL